MISFIRRQLSATNVLVVAALIFAMAGGAFAANGGKHNGHAAGHHHGHASKKHKGKKGKALAKRGPRGKEGPQGPAGPAGPQGPQGPQGEKGATGATGTNGTNGKDGTNGTNGKDGTNGVSVTSTAFTGNEHGCEAGGLAVTSASGTEYVCNGKEGATGPAGPAGESGNTPLKIGETETGFWGTVTDTEYNAAFFKEHVNPAITNTSIAMINYARPLAEELEGEQVVFMKAGEKETAECPGEEAKPLAAKGYLCMYALAESQIAFVKAYMPLKSGRGIFVGGEGPGGYVFGTWAVTAATE